MKGSIFMIRTTVFLKETHRTFLCDNKLGMSGYLRLLVDNEMDYINNTDIPQVQKSPQSVDSLPGKPKAKKKSKTSGTTGKYNKTEIIKKARETLQAIGGAPKFNLQETLNDLEDE